MHDDHKPGTRITIRRDSVTTIRWQTSSARLFCQNCRRPIEPGEPLPPGGEATESGTTSQSEDKQEDSRSTVTKITGTKP